MKPSVGDVFVNLSTRGKGVVVGGGPLPPSDEHPKGRLQPWRLTWETGSSTSVRCAGMAEAAGGWPPFEDAKEWRKA